MELREGTYDAEIVKEINSAYGWMDVEGKVVLDIGACFGAATLKFLENGAKLVIAVEPEPDNVKQLMKNTRKYRDRVVVLQAAVGEKAGEAALYINAGINTGGHSLHVKRGRSSLRVRLLGFRDLLAEHRPAVVKIDCEGAEHDFLTKPLPSYVKQVAMEIHLNKKRWRANFATIVALFKGWKVVKQPKCTENNWHTIGGYKR
jgi:FkbM family methyltransferase